MSKTKKLRIWVIMSSYGNGVCSFHENDPTPLTQEEEEDGKYIVEMGPTSELTDLLAKIGMARVLASEASGLLMNAFEEKIYKRIKRLKAWKIVQNGQ